MKRRVFYFSLFSLFLMMGQNSHSAPPIENSSDRSIILRALDDAKREVMVRQQNQQYWNMPLYLGSMYVSQYLLVRHWLEVSVKNSQLKLKSISPSEFDAERYKKLLLETQLKDGSWELIRDENRIHGDLNTTIWNYAALKVLGQDQSSSTMTRARRFILDRGGLEQSSLFSKITLSLFGNYSWSEIPWIPYTVFNENLPMNYRSFGQWVSPHLFPISYLKHTQVQKNLGPLFDLSELKVEKSKKKVKESATEIKMSGFRPAEDDRAIVLKMLETQKQYGSWGAYTLSTLFTLMAFDHYQNFFNDLDSKIDPATTRGLDFVEQLYFRTGENAYLGTACDGRYWDTMLIGQGLLEAGISKDDVKGVLPYLLNIQDATGGFGFGLDFERDYPDTDDTAEVMLYVFKHLDGKVEQSQQAADRMKRAAEWLFAMQNSDGGWGAFNKDNTGNLFLHFMTQNFLDSADLFDESSADVTAHIIEALGTYGSTIQNSESIRTAVDYLKNQQTEFGAWEGRWGTNYLYGTGAVLVGLRSAGVSVDEPFIRKASSWLMKCHNADGGYGESFDSYSNVQLACQGLSSPSQTAWALMGLIASGHGKTEVARRAALYLAQNFLKNGTWKDASAVGTGHPRIVPMQYPSYAWAFPMMALSRYLGQMD